MLPEAGTRLGNAGGNSAPIGVADLCYDDIPATADQLPRIRHALTAWVQQIDVSADHVDAVVLATYEAMANVVTHAYPHHRGTFNIRAAYRPDQRYVDIVVSDHGRWQPPSPSSLPYRGRGLQLIRALAADATVDRSAQGTTVHMRWPLPGDPPSLPGDPPSR
jgi:anti-sigma regulatory factor (Ser/Thr protein kinase)